MRGLCIIMLSVCLSFSALAQDSQPTSTATTQPTSLATQPSLALSTPVLLEEKSTINPHAFKLSLVPTLVSYGLAGVGGLLVFTDNSAEAFHAGRFLAGTAAVGAAIGPSLGEFASHQFGKGILGTSLRSLGVLGIGAGGSLFALGYFSCKGATQPCDPPGGAGLGLSVAAVGSVLTAAFSIRDLYASYRPTPRLYKKEQQASL